MPRARHRRFRGRRRTRRWPRFHRHRPFRHSDAVLPGRRRRAARPPRAPTNWAPPSSTRRRSSTTSISTSSPRRAPSSGMFFGCHPGHCALFEKGKLSLAPYWRPRFDELRNPSFAALRDEFHQIVKDAVTDRLAAGPAGLLLPQWRHRQLDGRRCHRPRDRPAGRQLFDRVRGRRLRRDGLRAHRSASTSAPSTTSTT
jgi:hypothetical protein